jgi:glycosyltransferase involved in cell wall biosynthesis
MRIGLNLLHAHPAIGGGWNYIKNIVTAIQTHDETNEYVAYCTPESECLIQEKPNVKKIIVGIRGTNRFARVFYENTLLHWWAWRDRVELMYWFTSTGSVFSSSKTLVTVYDLLGLMQPEAYNWTQRVYWRWMLPHTARTATLLAPMSEKTAADLADRFGVSRDRMVIVRNPLDARFRPVDPDAVRAFKEKYRLPDAMWLYVAHFYPHKNHARLFEAFSRVRAAIPQGWPLVLCGDAKGRKDELRRMLRQLHLDDAVIWLPRLTDEEMPVLYSAASALVFPSLFEGGGLPVMEAIACGCPVIASDIPTTREFAGDTAILFDPTDVQAIAQAMSVFEGDANLRDTCRQRGLDAAEKHSMYEAYSTLLVAYQKAARETAAA